MYVFDCGNKKQAASNRVQQPMRYLVLTYVSIFIRYVDKHSNGFVWHII